MKDLETHCQEVVICMREAVAEALETKRRMGYYAVIVENGEPRRVPAKQFEPLIAAAKAK